MDLFLSVYRRKFCRASVLLLSLAGSLLIPAQVSGQVQGNLGPLPKVEYYVLYQQFYRGEYTQVGRNMQSLSRAAFNDGGKFLDSVCYWTAMGECYYRLGEYTLALEQYEAALNLYLDLQIWPARTQMPPAIQPDQGAERRSSGVPWATTGRNPNYGKFDNRLLVMMGKTDAQNEAALRNGGSIDVARLRGVDIAEAMRCVSLALYRRHVIRGPTCPLDPFTKRLTTNLVGNGGGTLAASWTGVARGIAFASVGDNARATQLLTSSLQIGGRDHPLTPVALLTLGKIAANESRLPQAQELFIEASICAAAYEQYDMVEESLRYATLIHSAGQTMQPYPPLLSAIDWARRENRDTLQAALLITAAQVAAEAGDPAAAETWLTRAKREMSRNDLSKTDLQTRWLYTSAMVNYLRRDIADGDGQFARFLKAAQSTSLWLYQIAMADHAVREGVATERESEALYDALLNEPGEADWTFRPVETMAFLATPHYEPMERWFEVTLGRKAEEKAIGIAELIRRQRFYSHLPFGGRLVSLRWILEAPEEALSENARKQKAEVLQRYPAYKDLAGRAQTLQEQLAKIEIVPDTGSDERTRQKKLMQEYAAVVDEQELFLRQIALTREPLELAFPQPLGVTAVQQQLSTEQAIVSFLKIGQVYYVMNLTGSSYSIESRIQARTFDRKVIELLRQISIGDKSAVFDASVFMEEDWRKTARELSAMIFAKTEPQAIDSIEEITFVPDGKAWYLPMELLQYGSAETSDNLINHLRIRYAPMVNLAVPDSRTTRRFRRTGVVAHRNFIRDEAARIERGVADLRTAIADAEVIDKTFQEPSSLLTSTIDRLVVWHDNVDKAGRGGVFAFSPLQLDQGKPGAGLDAWMQLPWRGVDQLILSGVSTAVEGATRGRADGQELFLAATGLMASGARTVLISRWRVGGQSTLDLTRELAQELGRQPAAEAWQRSLELFFETDLDIAAEPRIREKVLDQPMKAVHPFFWAGYMLLDNGSEPNPADTPVDESQQTDDDSGESGN